MRDFGHLAGNQRVLIEAGPIHRIANSAKGIEPRLPPLPLVEKMPDSLFEELVGALKMAAGKFLLHLLGQIHG